MNFRPEFTESYEVHVKTKTFDRCLKIDASSSELLQNEDKLSFLKKSAILELKKLDVEIDMIDLTDFSFKKIEP
ncbi:MAG: hypothetical protein IKS94_06685 [Prevotella sp.]|nr:hypothetical protein [Prevotella sp.]